MWARWLLLHHVEYDRFDYDIRVGQGRPIDPEWPPYIQEMARHLSLKRIDAVGFKAGAPTIFEVSPRGSRTVYGALQLYGRLYPLAFPTQPAPRLAAVVGRADPDVLAVMREDGITVFVLGDT